VLDVIFGGEANGIVHIDVQPNRLLGFLSVFKLGCLPTGL
jgi:hypothetical protein